MSNVPHYQFIRKPTPYGHSQVFDPIIYDVLTDAYNNSLMGTCSEKFISEMGISREEQDAYAISSYQKARKAQDAGILAREIVQVEKSDPHGVHQNIILLDEEVGRFVPEKFPKLPPVFGKAGTITAANAGTLNDGAASVVVTDSEYAKERGLKPLF